MGTRHIDREMKKPERTAESNLLTQSLALGLALLTLLGFIAYAEFQDYQLTDRQERERLRFQAEVIEKNITPQLLLANRVIDGIIDDLPSWYAQNDDFKQANRQLRVINDTLIGIRPILVIKPDGTVIASSNETLVGMNFAQREYFKTAIHNPDPGILHVSAPFKTVLDTFVISLFRTIQGPDGKFAGLVIVSVIPEYFSNLLNSVRYVPDMRAAIIHGDGKVFLVSPPTPGLDGKDLAKPGTFLTRHLGSGQPASIFTGRVNSSGDERMAILRTVSLTTPAMDKPLIVAVSRDLKSIFEPWLDRLYLQSLSFCVIAIFSVLGLLIMHRRQRVQISERKQTELTRLASEQQLRAFYELDLVGLTITSPEKGWLRINRYLCDMLEYSEEELRGMTWMQLTHPDDLARDVEQFDRLVANEINGYSLEKRFITRSGKIVPANLVVRCIRKENGDVDYVIAMVEDITERKQMEDQVRRLAFYDPLTSLPNRRLFFDRQGQAMAASKRSGCYGALMFLDLDNFKPLNDTYGHDVGDLLLIEAADRLRSCVREIDTVARFGGDEFVVMLTELDVDKEESNAQAGVIAEKIRSSLSKPFRLAIKHPGKADTFIEYPCTASIGVVLFIGHESSQEDILKWADSAMYQAKQAGRNLIRFHDSNT